MRPSAAFAPVSGDRKRCLIALRNSLGPSPRLDCITNKAGCIRLREPPAELPVLPVVEGVSGAVGTSPSPSLRLNLPISRLPPFVTHPISAPANVGEGDDLDSISHLLSPLGGIRNLDVGVIDGSRQEGWGGVPATGNNACDPTGLLGSSHVPLRTYASDEDILNAYYVHIHPFLSILPPLLSDKISDRPIWVDVIEVEKSSLPHWPGSAFTLAVSAILASIALPQDSDRFAESRISRRRSAAQLFAGAAFYEVDNEIDRISRISIQTNLFTGPGTDVSVISPLSPALALIILSIHEYCQRGNVSCMRSRANQAITAAIDLGLHSLGAAATEAQRRAWWSALWPLLLQAEAAILSVSQILRNHSTHSTAESSSSPNISARITQPSLAMARAYERVAIFAEGGPTITACTTISPPQPHIVLPFFMCGALQASYVLLMTHYRLREALRSEVSTYRHLLHQPEPGFEVQDTERLLRELRQGIDSILRVMGLAIMFEGVGGMGGEIQAAYHGVCAGEFLRQTPRCLSNTRVLTRDYRGEKGKLADDLIYVQSKMTPDFTNRVKSLQQVLLQVFDILQATAHSQQSFIAALVTHCPPLDQTFHISQTGRMLKDQHLAWQLLRLRRALQPDGEQRRNPPPPGASAGATSHPANPSFVATHAPGHQPLRRL
ncbi:fungal specific transcription factor domain-containing protein [Aspergillus affinis]|uniref:fungal specific transcription factor domain-containing protein n=1 Tax=Aspergillus affinis TaxID=1070780 RepID=UPI0022FF1AF5|nr:uncharacterized protein KD926_008012 [Aspergillus affinis]KAI9045596.1 hypothetical protein KD926_008012 [Aspergillus affinis]